jgi:RNA polymerase sigma-70 factor (ECF subfamily)
MISNGYDFVATLSRTMTTLEVVLKPAPVSPRREDLALAERCVVGERAAQMELFQQHKRRVQATLYRVLGTNSHMEDLVQEAFFEVFRSLGGFRGDSQLATWIDRIAVRVAYAHLSRASASFVRLEAVPEIETDHPSAERRLLAREAVRRLYDALDRIEPVRRLAFSLHVLDERPLKMVAEIMGASIVATKARVWRARRELEKRLRHDAVLADFLATAKVDAGKAER